MLSINRDINNPTFIQHHGLKRKRETNENENETECVGKRLKKIYKINPADVLELIIPYVCSQTLLNIECVSKYFFKMSEEVWGVRMQRCHNIQWPDCQKEQRPNKWNFWLTRFFFHYVIDCGYHEEEKNIQIASIISKKYYNFIKDRFVFLKTYLNQDIRRLGSQTVKELPSEKEIRAEHLKLALEGSLNGSLILQFAFEMRKPDFNGEKLSLDYLELASKQGARKICKLAIELLFSQGYTASDFLHYPSLAKILKLAKNGDFDVLGFLHDQDFKYILLQHDSTSPYALLVIASVKQKKIHIRSARSRKIVENTAETPEQLCQKAIIEFGDKMTTKGAIAIGQRQYELGNLSSALSYYNKAFAIYELDGLSVLPKLHVLKAIDIAYESHRYRDVISLSRELLNKTNYRFNSIHLHAISKSYSFLNKISEVESFLHALIKCYPNEGNRKQVRPILVSLACVKSKLRKWNEAENLYNDLINDNDHLQDPLAITCRGENIKVSDFLMFLRNKKGVTQMKLKKWTPASSTFYQLHYNNQLYPKNYVFYAYAHAKLNNIDKIKEYYEIYKKEAEIEAASDAKNYLSPDRIEASKFIEEMLKSNTSDQMQLD